MTGREDRPFPLLAGLIGWPVAQSKSQKIHEFWLKRLGIDGHYVRLPVRPGEVARAFRGMVALGFAGVVVTDPSAGTPDLAGKAVYLCGDVSKAAVLAVMVSICCGLIDY